MNKERVHVDYDDHHRFVSITFPVLIIATSIFPRTFISCQALLYHSSAREKSAQSASSILGQSQFTIDSPQDPSRFTSPASLTSFPNPMSSRTLTAGAKAGIGIGVVLGAVIILALVFIIFRQRQKRNSSPEPKTDTCDEEQKAESPSTEAEQPDMLAPLQAKSELHEVILPEIGSVASFGALPGLRRKTPVPEPVYMESNGKAMADRKTKGSSVSAHQEALKALKALNISASPPSTSTGAVKGGPLPTAAELRHSSTT